MRCKGRAPVVDPLNQHLYKFVRQESRQTLRVGDIATGRLDGWHELNEALDIITSGDSANLELSGPDWPRSICKTADKAAELRCRSIPCPGNSFPIRRWLLVDESRQGLEHHLMNICYLSLNLEGNEEHAFYHSLGRPRVWPNLRIGTSMKLEGRKWKDGDDK
jgi:hypothetical protein